MNHVAKNYEQFVTPENDWKTQNIKTRMWLKNLYSSPDSLWHRLHSVDFTTRYTTESDLQKLPIDKLTTLNQAINYAREQRSLIENPRSKSSPARTIAKLRTYSDLAKNSENYGNKFISINNNGLTSEFTPIQLNAYIFGCATGALESKLINPSQWSAVIDGVACNNWDALVENDEWIGLEAIATCIMHFDESAINSAIQELIPFQDIDLLSLQDKNQDILTRFASHTLMYSRRIKSQYSTTPTKQQIHSRLINDNAIVLSAKNKDLQKVVFPHPTTPVTQSKIEAYAYLSALYLYEKSLAR